MKIAIGSTSAQKIKYLAECLDEIEIKNYEIIPVKALSGVSEQPLFSDEVLKGAANRAKTAFDITDIADFAIGIEVGYQLSTNDNFKIICHTVIYDGQKEISAKSNGFLLPNYHQQKLRAGLYLGDFVKDYYQGANPIKRKLASIIKDRDTIIKNAVLHSLLQYLNWEDYTNI